MFTDEPELLDHLVVAWAALPKRQQRVLFHWSVLGEPVEEVAEHLGAAASAVPELVERARLELGVRFREAAHEARSSRGRLPATG